MRDAIASRACRALFLLDGARAAKELNPLVARTPRGYRESGKDDGESRPDRSLTERA